MEAEQQMLADECAVGGSSDKVFYAWRLRKIWGDVIDEHTFIAINNMRKRYEEEV